MESKTEKILKVLDKLYEKEKKYSFKDPLRSLRSIKNSTAIISCLMHGKVFTLFLT